VILSRLANVDYSQLLGRIFDSALADTQRFPDNKKPSLTAYA
jgi:hypothetical protein